jgi:hypothetical protein
MSDVSTLLWQTEIFLSMSTKVTDPSLAATLQRTAEGYLSKATAAAKLEQVVSAPSAVDFAHATQR